MNQNGFNYYIETSSKTGDNVIDLFKILTKHLHIVKPQEAYDDTSLYKSTKSKKYQSV